MIDEIILFGLIGFILFLSFLFTGAMVGPPKDEKGSK